jgi:hypothetical protein
VATPSSACDAEARLRDQLARLDALRSAGEDLSPGSRLRLETATTRAIELLAKFRGEGQALDEARIVRLPAWRRVSEAIVAALVPYPEASAAVLAALRALGGES